MEESRYLAYTSHTPLISAASSFVEIAYMCSTSMPSLRRIAKPWNSTPRSYTDHYVASLSPAGHLLAVSLVPHSGASWVIGPPTQRHRVRSPRDSRDAALAQMGCFGYLPLRCIVRAPPSTELYLLVPTDVQVAGGGGGRGRVASDQPMW